MNNKYILAAIIFMLIIGGTILGYFLNKDNPPVAVSPTPFISVTASPTTTNTFSPDNIKYVTFSSSKADFTFEYPNTWIYTEAKDPQNNNLMGWNFYSGSEVKPDTPPIIEIAFPLSDVVNFCSTNYEYIDKKSFLLNVFPTNDPKTFITYEQCGGKYGVAYIYWQKGEHFTKADDIKDIHKINLMIFYSGSEENEKIAQHIAQSIKIK